MTTGSGLNLSIMPCQKAKPSCYCVKQTANVIHQVRCEEYMRIHMKTLLLLAPQSLGLGVWVNPRGNHQG